MNVRVRVELSQATTKHDKQQMREVARSLTDNKRSVAISTKRGEEESVIAEFTIPKARQIDVVDDIGRAFWMVDNYSDISISFPK